ncbi:MAG TPA: CotH kinase family protein [Planctomycetota bacterium]|nr:CotH kinase family protein [Planctomycetota bacterium]
MQMRRASFVGFVVILASWSSISAVLADHVLITEVATSNKTGFLDEDNDTSDWIEIFNASPAEVDLANWSLTDDPNDLRKWVFPETRLPSGGFLVVFASGKNRADPGAELHTGFRLTSQGEFLALVEADGQTMASRLDPYPLQVEDVSYGVALDSVTTSLIPADAPARVLVPTDDSLALTWTATAFDDAAWLLGPMGIGYDRKSTKTYTDLIKTDVETVMYRVNSSAYVRIPFNVANPSEFDAVTLRVKYEDGFIAYLNGTEIARRRTPATVAWNSRAAGARPDRDAVIFETINLSTAARDLVPGGNVLAFQALNDSMSSADFLILAELEAIEVTGVRTGVMEYFETPTPGLPNSGGAPGIAPVPELSHASGCYAEPLVLSLFTEAAGTAMRFTLDRTIPTEESTLYTAPLTLEATTMVRVRAFQPGYLPSPVVSRTFIQLQANVKDFTSNLPILVLESFGRPVSDAALTLGFGALMDVSRTTGRSSITGPPGVAEKVAFKWRGSSSLGFPKKNYALEIEDEVGEDKDVSILGMAPDSDWILHGPYSDKTQMRNYLSYDWSNQIGRWAVRCKFIEMYVNTSPAKLSTTSYVGIYVLMEKIKRGPDRVDLQRLYDSQTTEPGVSGGYILKKDRLDPGDAGLRTNRGTGPLGYVEPKEREITTAQKAYIKGYLDQYETALYGASFRDPVEGYAKYIDVDSFIDHHIIVELTKNIDGYRLSTFMFKDKGGKLNMGPVWDYNLSLGNADYLNGWLPEGWYYPQLGAGDYPWYARLFQDPAFLARYKERWIAFRASQFRIQPLIDQIDELATLLEESQVRNFQKWRTLGTYVWPNKFIGRTYAEEIGFMKGWLRDRILWMDGTFVPLPVFSQNGGGIDPGYKLTITAPSGTIYYTLNSADPRSDNEQVSAEAILYNEAEGITLTQNTRVSARVKDGQIWSGMKEASFLTDIPPLVITEIMYNPAPPPEGSAYRATDFEFIEIQNVGDAPIDLTGARFTRGITFTFAADSPVTRLEPNELAIVVKNPEAFATRYDVATIKIAGRYTGDFNDRSETLTLLGPLDEPIHEFAYSDAWHPETDGQGYSLVIIDPRGPRASWPMPESWRASAELNGSPGREESGASPGGRQFPGDINQDSKINLSDAIGILHHLFQGALPELPCEGGTIFDPGNKALLDVDGNASVQLGDAVYILTYLFQEGAPPVLGTECVPIAGCPDVCAP